MRLLEKLKLLLEKDERLVSEGKLLKNRIVELALKLDKDLIKLLLSNGRIKEHFFKDVDGILVFDKEKFMKFVDNKEFLPDSYTAFKNKIGLTADKNYIAQSKEVVLSWPYKDCILEGGQEESEEKRKEIFHNEILAPDEIDRLLDPKVFTNFKRIDADGEHEVKEIKPTDNLIIKGNNLLVLHSLKKKFAGKVKLIYIDPPYYFKDTKDEDTFKYNTNFKLSTWLTFMKNRLEIAKKLLKDDGIIFVQINGSGIAYLKVLLDEVFSSENEVSLITVKVKDAAGVGQQSLVFDINEYLLVYANNLEKLRSKLGETVEYEKVNTKIRGYKNHIIDYGIPRFVKEIERVRVGKIKIYSCENYRIDNAEMLDINDYFKNRENIAADYNPSGGMILAIRSEIPEEGLSFIEYTPVKGKNADQLTKVYFLNRRILSFLSDITVELNGRFFKKTKLTNLWNIPNASLHLEGGVTLKSGKKPEVLLYKIIELFTDPKDIILDFFMGTGTTCAVAHKMGRQYIGVEQLDYGGNSAVVRLKNVINGDQSGISKAVNWEGGGDFVYMELKELNEEFVQKIKKAKDTKELLKIWEDMKQHAFLSYRVDPKLFDENIEEFKKLSAEEQKRLLIECLDANNLYVNYSEMEDKQYGISREDIKLNKKFYKKRNC